jgi:hypothetical protein
MNTLENKIGLCQTCRNVRAISTARGSTFYLCRLAESDSRFPKYPRLPVSACAGYESTADPKLLKNEPPQPGNEGKQVGTLEMNRK